MKKGDGTTIWVSREVKLFLNTNGKKGESYDQILRRLLAKIGARFNKPQD